MKRWKNCCRIAAIGLSVLLLTGCGDNKLPTDYEKTSVILGETGSVKLLLIEEFDRDYYDVDELSAMAKTEVTSFNEEHQEEAVLESIVRHQDDSHVELTYSFENADCFSDFTGSSLFYGTVQEALDRNVKFPSGFRAAKDGSVIADIEVKASKKYYIMATDEKCIIYSSLKPFCFSEGVVITEDGGIDLGSTVGTAYVVFR